MEYETGRPKLYTQQEEAMVKSSVRTTNWHIRAARKIGEGNFSEGVRVCIERTVVELGNRDTLPRPLRNTD